MVYNYTSANCYITLLCVYLHFFCCTGIFIYSGMFLGEIYWLAFDYITAQFCYFVHITPCIFWLTCEKQRVLNDN